MKNEKVKKGKKESTIEQPQDLYNIYMAHGVPKDRILSLGYVGIGSESFLKDLPVEKRNSMFFICQNLHVVISEAMKSKEYRDTNKMLGFLQMAIDESEKFYKDKSDDLLFHELTPHE